MHLLREDSKMLTKLMPDQISKFWPIIKYAIEQSLPPTVGEHPDKMNRILSSTLSGTTEVWAMYEKGNKIKLEAIILTRLVLDDASGTRSLLLYCLYGYEEVSDDKWGDGLSILFKYAKANKCSKIVAYSSIPHIINLANKFGASTEYTFISFDLSKIV